MLRTTATLPFLLTLAVLAAPALAQSAGALAFNRCKICHSLAADGHSPVGPNLHGLYGRPAGTLPGFAYSPAMKNSGVVWNDDTLGKFLRDPAGFMPGNRMGFPGIQDERVLADLLSFLKEQTRSP